MTSAWQKFLDKNQNTPLDMLNPKTKLAPDNVFKDRYSTCQICEFFIKLSGQCSKCGCFMKAKASIESSSCPVGKWII